MSEHNYRAEVEQHCDGCKCEQSSKLDAEEIVRALTGSLARDERTHSPDAA